MSGKCSLYRMRLSEFFVLYPVFMDEVALDNFICQINKYGGAERDCKN